MSLDLFDTVLPMPCLSLWEPWASLIVAGFKRHETRHWPTNVRGRIAIHASKRVDVGDAPHELCEFAFGEGWAKTRPIGCVVAVADLVGCYRTEALTDPRGVKLLGELADCDVQAGNFGPGRYGFRFANVRALAEPLPLSGRQGFFRWMPPADLERRLLPANDHAAAAARWLARAA